MKQPLFLLYTLRLDGFDVPPKKGNKLIKKQGLLSLFLRDYAMEVVDQLEENKKGLKREVHKINIRRR